MPLVSPKVDFVFKKLFGTEENKQLLIGFVNSIISEEDRVQDLILRNPYNPKNFAKDKLSILDIKAQDENISTLLDRWANFLKKADQYGRNNLPKELQEVASIKKAMELLETMSMNEEELEIYEARLKLLRDEDAHIKTREAKAKAEGEAAGKAAKAIAVAENMIRRKMSDKEVSEITELREEEVREIRKRLGL